MSHNASPMAGMASASIDLVAPPRAVNCRATLDIRSMPRYKLGMEIESIRHKGLRRFFETGNAKGLVGDAGRLRKMLAFIDAAESFEELSVPPNFGLHELTGDRKGSWSMTVTRNWRMRSEEHTSELQSLMRTSY